MWGTGSLPAGMSYITPNRGHSRRSVTQISTAPTMSRMKPERTISGSGTSPEP
jgi:hypothetical protein